jgi:hypothetical protein
MKQILAELHMEKSVAQQMDEIRQEWESGSYSCLLLHVYSGLSEQRFTSRIAQALQEIFPDALVAGTMSAGEIMDGRLMPKGVLVSAMLFQSTDVRLLHYDHVKDNEGAVGRQIRCDLEAIPCIRGAELLFPGTELNTRPFFEELSQLRRDIQIWGGYSGGHMLNAPVHFIFDPTGVMYDSVLVTAFA